MKKRLLSFGIGATILLAIPLAHRVLAPPADRRSLPTVETFRGTASSSSKPEGTFVITVTFPMGVPPFQELLTFHKGGTISETNTTLHPNSSSPFFSFNGSDGYGAWERGSDDTVVFKFVKLVFDGVTNEHFGYLVATRIALIENDQFTSLESDVNLLIGPDLFNPLGVIPFGSSDAVGTRITVDEDDDS